MKDNFDLKKFLSENKLTAGSRQLTEEVSEDVWKRLDAAIAEDDGEAMKAIALELLGKAGNWAKEKVKQGAEWSKQKLMKAHGITDDDLNEAFNPKSKLAEVIAQAWAEKDLEKAKQIIRDLIEPSRVKAKDDILRNMEPIQSKAKFDYYLANSLLKFEGLGLNETTETTEITESTMTEREQYIVSLVENALGLEGYGDDNVINKLEKRNQEPPVEQPTYSEGDEMVQENPLPEYNTIEELMKEIDDNTNKAALEYKMKRTKEIYEALEEQLTSLEEGDHAKHIDKRHTKQMRKDISALRKNEEKLIKEYERRYEKKATKKAAPKKEEEVPMEELALNESKDFDLRKFLVENKLTSNSKIIE